MANRGKTRQIEDVIRSKIVVEIGVFYYRCPCVTLGDLECVGVRGWSTYWKLSVYAERSYIELLARQGIQ